MLALMFFCFILFLGGLTSCNLLFFLIFFLIFPYLWLLNFSESFLSKNFFISLDCYSLMMIMMTFLILIFCFISFELSMWKNSFFFYFNILLLFFSLFFFFVVSNLFLFFFFFESTLFPTLFLILGWGNNIERIQSSYYLIYYTFFSSMPMIVSMFFFFNNSFSLNFFFIGSVDLKAIYFFIVMSFLVKMPMFLVHSWLPKAHVEAPVFGSMVLAGVLLKMGGYGIFRFLFFFKFFLNLNLMWIYISIWGGIVSSLICFRQSDLKCLVAYSSVSHMSLVISGLFFMSKISILGSFYLMLAHGFCSSGLFFLVNLVYIRSGTRNIVLNKGLMNCFPSLSLWWFLFCVMNMGCPPSLNLIAEIFLIVSCLTWSFSFFAFLMIFSFFSAVYNLFLYTFTNHGFPNSNFLFLNPLLIREYYLILLHFFPILFFFLKIDCF